MKTELKMNYESKVPIEEWIDISDQKRRVYCFPDMQVIIANPVRVKITRKPEGDSHRVIDSMNVAHYIPAGWRRLYWTSTKENPFLF